MLCLHEPSLFPISDLLAALGGTGEVFHDSFAIQVEPLEGADLHVIAFRGVEQMSTLYAFDVLFWGAGLEDHDLVNECLARRVELSIPYPGGVRTVHGIATTVELLGVHGERRAYRLRLSPRAWLLSKTTDTRVFQDMSVPQVIGEVLRACGIPYVFSLAATYAPRRYCLQYEETDLAFVTRLAAEEGIFFCFEQLATDEEARRAGVDRAGEIMVFGDTKALYAPIAGSPELLYAPDALGALQSKESHVTAFRSAWNVASNVATVRGYDYTMASYRGPDDEAQVALVARGVLEAAHASPPGAAGKLEVYEHHDDYEDIGVTGLVARTRLEQLRASAVEGTGITWCRRLSPGRSFRLMDHEVTALDREYAVTGVRHEGNGRRGADIPVYRCEFSCVPAEVPFRPARPPRRVHQAVETGLVVGPASEDIETDRYGCVRVQFHWDRRGRHDEHSSCWIRVMQAWAGPTYGFQFVPRIGMEVLVSFIGGDVDRPVVIGCMPNPGNAPPIVLPQNKTQSAIRTRTVPLGTDGSPGYNEIAFDDQAGKELLGLRAQRNLEELVLHDRIRKVGHDQYSSVGGSRSAKIGATDSAEVGGNRERTVKGSNVEKVKGDAVLECAGSRAVRVVKDVEERNGGRRHVAVAKTLVTVVGQKGVVADNRSIATGAHRIDAAKQIRLNSPESILLTCGSSSVEIGPESITLRSKRILLSGGEEVTAKVDKSEVRVAKDEVATLSKKIGQRSEGAKVLLDAAAKVTPSWVDGAEGPKDEARKDVAPSPGVATFKIDPPPGTTGPLTLRIATPSGEIVERKTDESFEVRMEGVEGDAFVLLDVRLGDHLLQHAEEPSS